MNEEQETCEGAGVVKGSLSPSVGSVANCLCFNISSNIRNKVLHKIHNKATESESVLHKLNKQNTACDLLQ